MDDPTGALIQTALVITTGLILDAPVSRAEWPEPGAEGAWERVEVYTLTAAERILDSLPADSRGSRLVVVGQGTFVVEWRKFGEAEPSCRPPEWTPRIILAMGLVIWVGIIFLISAIAG